MLHIRRVVGRRLLHHVQDAGHHEAVLRSVGAKLQSKLKVAGVFTLGLGTGYILGSKDVGHADTKPIYTPESRRPSGETPGRDIPIASKMLDRGAQLMQSFTPLKKIHQHLCGFHFYANDINRQLEAHHYCSMLNDEVHQCLIYDSASENARLIGIEYIISERLFNSLPADERRFWHSHKYEVKSGQLVMPSSRLVPDAAHEAAETAVMSELINTYGKTVHTWQVDRGDQLPIGPPQLMMAFTNDNQIRQAIVNERDRKFNINTDEIRNNRASIPWTPKLPGADHWEKGDGAWQLTLEKQQAATLIH